MQLGQKRRKKKLKIAVLVCADRMLNLKEKWFSPCCDSVLDSWALALILPCVEQSISLPFMTARLNLSLSERGDHNETRPPLPTIMAARHF